MATEAPLLAEEQEQRVNLLAGLKKLADTGCGQDLILYTIDDQPVRCHSITASANSDYIKQHVAQKLSEIKTRADGRTLESIVQYFYSGRIQVDRNSMENLLTTSHLMKLDNIVTRCLSLIETSISIDNYQQYMRLADEENLDDLRELCHDFIASSFKELVKSHKVEEMSFELLSAVMKSTNCNVDSEDDVLEAVINWFHYNNNKVQTASDKEELAIKAVDLLRNVHGALCSPAKLYNSMDENELPPQMTMRINDMGTKHLLYKESKKRNVPEIQPRQYHQVSECNTIVIRL